MATNPFTGIISPALKTLFKQGMDEAISGCSVPCQLRYFTTKYETDTAAAYDPIGKKTPNRTITGAPAPFSMSQPGPMNDAQNKKVTVQTEDVDLCVVFDMRKFVPMSTKVTSGDNYVQTLCSVDLLEKIMQCQELVADTTLTNRLRITLARAGDPEPCGLGESSYIVCLWKKV